MSNKTVRVRKKEKTGNHVFRDSTTDTLVTIKAGEVWECSAEAAESLDPNLWTFLDPVEEEAVGGPSRRTPPKPKVGLKKVALDGEGEGSFDVVNEKTKKRINDNPLTEAEADTLIEEGM